MRQFSENVKLLMQTDFPAAFFLITIVSKLGTTRETDLAYPVTVSGLGTFQSSDYLLSVEPPRTSNVVDRETYKVVYADPSMEKLAYFENVLTGSLMTIRVGFYNTTSNQLGGADPGMPLLNPEDIFISYEGVVDTQGYTVTAAEGRVTAVIECSSPVASLGLVKAFHTSRDNLRQINPADNSFDQVYVGSSQVSQLWGKP